jgi:hypothetical protein
MITRRPASRTESALFLTNSSRHWSVRGGCNTQRRHNADGGCETINGRSFRPQIEFLRKGAPPRLLLANELHGVSAVSVPLIAFWPPVLSMKYATNGELKSYA